MITQTDPTSGIIFLILRIVLAAALYVFLGWALYALWQDLKRQTRLVGASQVPTLTLIQQTEDAVRSYRFNEPEVMIGRDPACDCHLEDQTISAQHARLSYHHGQWWIEDLRSTNGTFINQEPVSAPLVIITGDELRCGQVKMRILTGENGVHEADAGNQT